MAIRRMVGREMGRREIGRREMVRREVGTSRIRAMRSRISDFLRQKRPKKKSPDTEVRQKSAEKSPEFAEVDLRKVFLEERSEIDGMLSDVSRGLAGMENLRELAITFDPKKRRELEENLKREKEKLRDLEEKQQKEIKTAGTFQKQRNVGLIMTQRSIVGKLEQLKRENEYPPERLNRIEEALADITDKLESALTPFTGEEENWVRAQKIELNKLIKWFKKEKNE